MKIRKQLIQDVETALGHLKDASANSTWQRAAARMLVEAAAEIQASLEAKANGTRVAHLESEVGQ
jgi:hypothetical protein